MCLEKGAGSAAGKWKLGVKANIERITFERAKAAGEQLDGSAGVWPRLAPRLGLAVVGRCYGRRRATILNMCRHLLIFLANRVGAPAPTSGTRLAEPSKC